MKKLQLERLERRLLEERQRVIGELSSSKRALRDDADRIAGVPDPSDSVDAATDRMATEEEAARADRQSTELQHINNALRALYQAPAEYGRCAVCGQEIAPERLEVLPETRVCGRHANGRRR